MYMAIIDLWQISQLLIFDLSRGKYHYLSQVRNFRFLFSYFVLLPLSGEVLKDAVCQEIRFYCAFSRHNTINLDKRPWIEKGQRFAIHLLT